MKNIYLLVGPSGSGKTTLAQRMADFYGMKVVQSYTTRPPRYEGEVGHIFVSDEEFDALGKMVAYTEYGGYRYGVTQEIVDTHDIYVIDPYGVEYMQSRYTGKKGIVVIWINAPEAVRRTRMEKRGDSPEKIEERIFLDKKEFDLGAQDFVPDIVLPSSNKDNMQQPYLPLCDLNTGWLRPWPLGVLKMADVLWNYIRYLEDYCE